MQSLASASAIAGQLKVLLVMTIALSQLYMRKVVTMLLIQNKFEL